MEVLACFEFCSRSILELPIFFILKKEKIGTAMSLQKTEPVNTG
jgi:hypothetical protein